MQNSFCDEISKRPSIWVERTTITKSATAAAGSGDLHAYRRFKRAETLRQREEEEIFQEKLEHEEFQKIRLENFLKCQEVTNKKHDKRQKEKLKLKMKKELKKIEKEAVVLNKYANDGSFISKFLPKFQEQVQTSNQAKIEQQNQECIINQQEETKEQLQDNQQESDNSNQQDKKSENNLDDQQNQSSQQSDHSNQIQ